MTAAFVHPYEAVAIYYPVSNTLEYIVRDVATFAQDAAPGLAILRDVQTREIIGWRIEHWSEIAETLK